MNNRFKKTVAIFLFTIALTSGLVVSDNAYAYADMQDVQGVESGFFDTLAEFFEELLNEVCDVIAVPGG